MHILPNIGVLRTDSQTEKLRKRFMNAMALLMSNGGLLWGGLSLYYGFYIAGIIPLTYTFLTGINLTYFHLTKNFKVYRFTQVLMSLLLPFFFQWSLGGFVASGAMMIWALLSLIGSMSVQGYKHSIRWFVVFVVFIIISGVFDSMFKGFRENLPPDNTVVFFFAINIIVISGAVFGLTLYYIHSRNIANSDLQGLTDTLEQKVEERTFELQEANVELKSLNDELHTTITKVQEQSGIIESKNKSITDSLNYAKRIQQSIISKSDQACSKMNETFILFKPRDIVSGDFYWFHCNEEEEYLIAAVVDCTGHGVPGAFMSLIGDSLLNQIIIDKAYTEPSEILTQMNLGVQRAMKIEGSNRRDGMDMAITLIDKKNKVVKYAGAKSPMVYIYNNELTYYKGSTHTIGGGTVKTDKTFVTHTMAIQPGAQLYMFSDGFPDQFGGSKNRKYLIKRFREFLFSIHNSSLSDQRECLKHELNNWKDKNKQTDDILVVGIKIQ